MFVKEEVASNGDICTTSVVTEVPTEDVFEEVEDVSVTVLSYFCMYYVIYILSQCQSMLPSGNKISLRNIIRNAVNLTLNSFLV
jgi:hypothetical protein